MKNCLLLAGLLSLALTNNFPLGTVVDGNINHGKNNTILSPGNYVQGNGNIVAPLDSSFDPFANNPFFHPQNLRNEHTSNNKDLFFNQPKNFHYPTHNSNNFATPIKPHEQTKSNKLSEKWIQSLFLIIFTFLISTI